MIEHIQLLFFVENRQLLGELEGIDLLLQQLSVSHMLFRCSLFGVIILCVA